MADDEYTNALKARLAALSPKKRARLEQKLRASPKADSIAENSAEVIQLQVGSGGLPVYFIYAQPAEIELARAMGVGYRIFGIEILWPLSWRNAAAKNNLAKLPTMEQLVARFVAVLSNHVGSSPCVLAGYSFAGVMAFEAAHQFQRQGGKVEMVMLLDAFGRRPPPGKRLPLGKRAPQGKPPQLLSVARSKLRKGWERALSTARAERPSSSIGVRLLSTWLLFRDTLEFVKIKKTLFLRPASSSYSFMTDERHESVPCDLVGRIYENCFNSYDFRVLDSHGFLLRASHDQSAYDESLGWKDLFAKGLEIVSVPGDHYTIISESTLTARIMTKVLRGLSMREGNTL
ncbi:MAG: thioesterase domain-containing protein [Xanthobacteraceae bacterium]